MTRTQLAKARRSLTSAQLHLSDAAAEIRDTCLLHDMAEVSLVATSALAGALDSVLGRGELSRLQQCG